MPEPQNDLAKPILVLDAMGVIYRVGDDIPELLVPFVRQHNGIEDAAAIEEIYRRASLGAFDSRELWGRVGVAPNLEDEYLAKFELSPGLLELLSEVPAKYQSVVCLSNDVSEWSRKLRCRFRLEHRFAAWFISGDLKLRKPDPQIYARVLADLDVPAERLVFVDDRVKNLDAAADLGFVTIYYQPAAAGPAGRHRVIRRLSELLE